MRRYAVGQLLLLATLGPLGGCSSRKTPTSLEDTQLAQRIERLVDTFLTSDDNAREASALADARAIFEREGLPTVGRVGEEVAPARGMADVRHPEQDLAVVTETFRWRRADSRGADYERKGGEAADDTDSE